MTMHSLANDMEKQLKSLILDTTNNNPAPKWAVIYSVSDDYCYADIKMDGGILKAVECFGYPQEGSKCIIIFIDGDTNNMVALCNPMTMVNYEGSMTPNYNIFMNGSFEKINSSNTFTNWNGGVKCSDDPYVGNYCCEIKPGKTLTSVYTDITSLFTESQEKNTPIMVSLFWKGGKTELTCLDQDGEEIVYTPYSLGETKQILDETEEWTFQRINFIPGNVTKIKIKLENKSENSTYIDGVRIWRPDNQEKWYPSEND